MTSAYIAYMGFLDGAPYDEGLADISIYGRLRDNSVLPMISIYGHLIVCITGVCIIGWGVHSLFSPFPKERERDGERQRERQGERDGHEYLYIWA